LSDYKELFINTIATIVLLIKSGQYAEKKVWILRQMKHEHLRKERLN